jgi:hypothetical protein
MRIEMVKKRIMIPIAVVLALLLGGFVLSAYLYDKHCIQSDMEEQAKRIENYLKGHIDEDSEAMKMALISICEDEFIKQALEKADRKALLERAIPLFRRLSNESEITHFYFTGPDRVNILRVHKPERFGDTIDRYTTLEAEKTRKAVQGVELGPLGTFTFRVVQPWIENDRLIGFVELGHEMNHLIDLIRKTLDVDIIMLIKKQFLKRQDWESGMEMLGRKGEWDRFPDMVSTNYFPIDTPEKFISRLAAGDFGMASTDIEFPSNGRLYHFLFLPLEDASGQDVGILVAMSNITDRRAGLIRFVLTVSLVCAAVGCLLITFFSLYISHLEKKNGVMN